MFFRILKEDKPILFRQRDLKANLIFPAIINLQSEIHKCIHLQPKDIFQDAEAWNSE